MRSIVERATRAPHPGIAVVAARYGLTFVPEATASAISPADRLSG